MTQQKLHAAAEPRKTVWTGWPRRTRTAGWPNASFNPQVGGRGEGGHEEDDDMNEEGNKEVEDAEGSIVGIRRSARRRKREWP